MAAPLKRESEPENGAAQRGSSVQQSDDRKYQQRRFDVTSFLAKMAARKVLRLAERQARCVRPLPRPPQRISQWREAQGLSPSLSGPGPLRDLPDWSFADGRPSPPWRGQRRRNRENEELVRRALALSRSLEAAKLRGSPERIPVQTSMER